jgi:hypothetical protein
MKRLALEKETTVQNLLAEALDDLFNKYSAPTKTKPRYGIGLSGAEHHTHDTKYETRS